MFSAFDSHCGEVCGLKWSPDERQLTSGAADRLVNVWSESQINAQSSPPPIFSFNDHLSTVKAIEYVPFLGGVNCNMVATGGGVNDNTVKIWNLSTGTIHSSLDTENKVGFKCDIFREKSTFRFLQSSSTRNIARWL